MMFADAADSEIDCRQDARTSSAQAENVHPAPAQRIWPTAFNTDTAETRLPVATRTTHRPEAERWSGRSGFRSVPGSEDCCRSSGACSNEGEQGHQARPPRSSFCNGKGAFGHSSIKFILRAHSVRVETSWASVVGVALVLLRLHIAESRHVDQICFGQLPQVVRQKLAGSHLPPNALIEFFALLPHRAYVNGCPCTSRGTRTDSMVTGEEGGSLVSSDAPK